MMKVGSQHAGLRIRIALLLTKPGSTELLTLTPLAEVGPCAENAPCLGKM
jgi:hypothetical protein